jgi:hypothetical protein
VLRGTALFCLDFEKKIYRREKFFSVRQHRQERFVYGTEIDYGFLELCKFEIC